MSVCPSCTVPSINCLSIHPSLPTPWLLLMVVVLWSLWSDLLLLFLLLLPLILAVTVWVGVGVGISRVQHCC